MPTKQRVNCFKLSIALSNEREQVTKAYMNQPQVEKELRFLKIYAVVLTLVCAGLVAAVFNLFTTKNFKELNVERINIVETNGQLKMVLSNKARQHPGTVDGVTFTERQGQRPAGMIFFGENGNEIGGFVFEGTKDGQGGSLTFDKLRSDQTVQFTHQEGADGNYFAGLKMNDQNLPMMDLVNKQKEIEKLPTKEAQDAAYQELRSQGLLMTERLKIGRDFDKSSVIKMKDASGKVRIEMKVEATGNPKLDFIDENGKVVYSLPERKN